MPYVESLEEFSARQRLTPILVGERYLFANGAQSNGEWHVEPPEEPDELARLRHEYLSARLKQVITVYNNDRTTIGEQARYHEMGAGPMPEPGWESHLKKLADEIESLQVQVQEAYAQLPQAHMENFHDAQRAEQRHKAGQVFPVLNHLPTF